ncbi:MAG: hypothetical protein RLZZ480_205 [Candidatus Parcubacteria bacterium]|jgi:hypothetical protein
MSVSTLLHHLRPHGRWTKEARLIYTTRRLLAFFRKNPELIPVALGYNPDSRVLWDGIFRFFFRHFPTRTDTYTEFGKEQKRQWWYNEETFDPKWDKLMHEYRAGVAFNTIVRPYLKQKSEE